ncbi:Uncharacterised protein [Raoultella terrigena]|nr:Uncharacterised protein [Raoultella terrigena]
MEILEGHNKFYVNDAEGNQVAEIVFVPTGEHLSIIEHTDVDESLKGQGVGKKAGGESGGKNARRAA